MRLPRVEVFVHVEDVAIRPRQFIEIGNRGPGRCANRAAIFAEDYSAHLFEALQSFLLKPGDEFLQRGFAFADSDDVDAVVEIKVAPFGGVGAPDHHEFHSFCLCDLRQLENILTRDDVGVEPHDARLHPLYRVFEIGKIAERGIEDIDGEFVLLEIGRQIQDAQGWIRLHHPALNDVVFEEVRVAQQDVSHEQNSINVDPIRGRRALVW